MKTVVKTGIFLIMISFFIGNIAAQGTPPPPEKMTAEERVEKQVERMTKELNLTQEQQAKIKELNLKQAQEMETQRAKMEAEREKMKAEREAQRKEMKAKREQMKAKMDAREAEFKSILTPEQYELWKSKKEEMRKPDDRKGPRKEGFRRGGPDGKGQGDKEMKRGFRKEREPRENKE